MTRFAEIFRFEVRQTARRPSTWLFLALLLSCSILLSATSVDPGQRSHHNAPVNVAALTLLVGLAGVLVSAALFGDAAHRDVGSRMHPLFHSAPIGKGEYLAGRFLGALAVNAVLLLAVPVGIALGMRMPGLDAATLGPFRAAAHLQPYLLLLLPSLLVNGAILFAVSLLSRRAFPGYLAALGLLVGYILAAAITSEMRHPAAAALLDPSGLVAVMESASDWTPVEQNTRLIVLEGILLWNRLLWVAVAGVVLAFTYARFELAHPAEGGGRRRAPADTAASKVRARRGVAPTVQPVFGFGTRVGQVLAIARRSFREILVSRDFLILAAGLALFVLVLGGESLAEDRFGVHSWPLTQFVSGYLRGFHVAMIVSLLTAFYAGELVWRERESGMSEIADAAPVPDWVPFLGRFLALALTLVVVQAVLVAAGIALQAMWGFHAFEIDVYLKVLFGFQLADYLLLAAVAMLVHVLVDHKYVGHLLVSAFYLVTVFHGRLGIEHRLLVYASDPGWLYSDMTGFGPYAAPVLWFKLYWAGWALLLAVVTTLFWVRGRERGLRWRVRMAGVRFGRGAASGIALAAGLILTLGGFVFYNTNVLNEYRSASESEAWRAGYERDYKRFEAVPQPKISAARLHVEIRPGARRVDIRGSYRLVNRTGEPIDSIHLSVRSMVETRSIGFDRAARRVFRDPEHEYRIYALAEPLLPGDSMGMRFEVVHRPRGFTNQRLGTAVLKNGTFIDRWWMPVIGYQRDLEIASSHTRREQGMPPRPFRPSIHDLEARRVARTSAADADWIDFEAVVGTAADEIAVAPGSLQRSWTENGRRYFHYRSDAPMLGFYGILSSSYAVHEDRWNDVGIQIFHHPDHGFNRERLARSVRASLEYYTKSFGPYPHRQLRLVEFPRYRVFARAYPGQVVFSEGSSLMARVDEAAGDIDSPLMVTAHEVAHQWWGHQVQGADVQGSSVLSETLAQYGALMVMEKTHGTAPVHAFLRTMQIEYLNRRGNRSSPEVPLLVTGDHDHIHYRKGAVVMYALRDYVGEERVNTALRRLVEDHAFGGPPYPTSLDLYRELRAVTPDSLHPLLEDLFATITLWDLRTKSARAEPIGGGRHRVTIEVEARKVRSDSIGNDTEVPMDHAVEIGVFAPGGDADTPGEPLYLRKHRVRSGRQTITVEVRGTPARAGIDPFHKLIVRHKDEMRAKVREVEVGG